MFRWLALQGKRHGLSSNPYVVCIKKKSSMKGSSIVFLSVFVCASSANAQHRTATPCPGVTEISNCQVEGCGSGADAELNKAKNIRSPDGTTPTLRTVQWWKELKNPRGADCRNREKLRELGREK
jgi:hypothetical protein